MKWLVATSIIVASVAMATPGEAKGCIKGAIVGGIAGHLAGGHGTAGAVAGCAIGHHEANKKDQQDQQKAAPDQSGDHS